MNKFEVSRPNKMAEWIENQVTEWASSQVLEHFDVEEIQNCTREQMLEIVDEYYEMEESYPELAIGFQNLIYEWETENHDQEALL